MAPTSRVAAVAIALAGFPPLGFQLGVCTAALTSTAAAPSTRAAANHSLADLHLTAGSHGGNESSVEMCEHFDNLWYQTSTLQPLVTDTLCNYPGSDFVELTFDFPSTSSSLRAAPMPVTAIACFASFDEGSDAASGAAAETQVVSAQGVDRGGIVLHRFAVELRREPRTEFLTNLRVRCDFTLSAPAGTSRVQRCARSFVLASCEGPGVVAKGCAGGEALTCVLDKCAGDELPGPFEACGGTILRADAVGNAVAVRGGGECCQACDREMQCVSLLNVPVEQQDVRRCELRPSSRPRSGWRRSEDAAAVDARVEADAFAAVLPAQWRRSAGVRRRSSRDAPLLAAVLAGVALAVVGAAAVRRRGVADPIAEEAAASYVLMRR